MLSRPSRFQNKHSRVEESLSKPFQSSGNCRPLREYACSFIVWGKKKSRLRVFLVDNIAFPPTKARKRKARLTPTLTEFPEEGRPRCERRAVKWTTFDGHQSSEGRNQRAAERCGHRPWPAFERMLRMLKKRMHLPKFLPDDPAFFLQFRDSSS